MHFCVLATRGTGGFSVPRKYGLNWFMPALANSNVGSPSGTTGLDGTFLCPCFLQKKSMNCWRISLDDGMTELPKGDNRSWEKTQKGAESSRGGWPIGLCGVRIAKKRKTGQYLFDRCEQLG